MIPSAIGLRVMLPVQIKTIEGIRLLQGVVEYIWEK